MSLDLVQHPYVRALAWTLVHFLWQGAIVGVFAFAILRIGRLSAPARYGVGVSTLGLLLAAPVATFAYLAPIESASRAHAIAAAPATAPYAVPAHVSVPAAQATFEETATTPPAWNSQRVLAILVGAWFVGVIALSVRFLGGWIVARRLARRAVTPVAPDIQALAQRVAARLSLRRVVSIFESASLSVPVMIGWLAPAVLIPAAALSGLTPTQIESLLAHELAHVRRHDYLVNLLQSAVETLLFYHPAVWWISRQVRRDRELCCDDLAVTVCDRLVYASALTDLAALATPRFALAATDGQLVKRVRRILGQSDDDRESGSSWMPAVILAAMVSAFVPGVVATHASDAPARPIAPPTVTQTQPQTPAPVTEHTSTTSRPQTSSTQTTTTQTRTAPAQTRAEDQARQDADEIRRRYEEAQQALLGQAERLKASQMQLDDIARRKLELQMANQEAVALDRINAIKTSLDATQRELARTRDRVEKGLLGQDALQAVEYQVAGFQRELDTAIRERAFQSQASQLQIAEIARQRDVEQLRAQYEDAQKQADVTRALAEQLRERNRDFESTRADIGATEPARAGDSFIVDIAGEPDLPRVYDMRTDGTIRLPLIGMIKVSGLNAKQAQEAIGKLLADRRLGSAADVRVTIRRSQK